MKKKLLTYSLSLLITTASFGKGHFQQPPADTTIEDIKKEDELIDEVVKSRALPKKEKVQYFSQVTKYGFKNLFSNYSYNASLPYTNQVNPNAEFFIQEYMRGHSKYLLKMKGWGQPYFNLIENVLIQYGLPKELKYIAVIESNLSTAATSPVGAGGPWQFMPGTARTYGLMVNSAIDDRRDYYKSTHAAARYLLSLYKDLHDWLLVMAAYNGGPGRVYSAMKKSGSKNFWSLQYYLPEESRTYVKRFIATHYIMEGSGGIATSGSGFIPAYNENGTGNLKQPNNLTEAELAEVEMLPVSGKFNSLVIAKNLSMDIVSFNHYNPDFDAMLASTGNYKLRLPPDKMQYFVANKYSILNECVQVLLGGATIPVTRTTYPVKTPQKKRG
ncbi:MAG: lytic transglycosylase domain-containing protein [Chitinophagaceae bacterium]|nr:lytic transglycosylase domain-containing protein [Chitinophagaceae bacterium]